MQSLEDQCSPSLVDIAIKSILDANPILKFAMTGSLGKCSLDARHYYLHKIEYIIHTPDNAFSSTKF